MTPTLDLLATATTTPTATATPTSPALPALQLHYGAPFSAQAADEVVSVDTVFTATLAVTNTGQTALVSVLVELHFAPEFLRPQRAIPPPQTADQRVWRWDLAANQPLQPGEVRLVMLTFVAVASSVGLPDGKTQSEAISRGSVDEWGQGVDTQTAQLTLRIIRPAISLQKRLAPDTSDSIGIGSLVTYTLDVENVGDTALTHFSLGDLYKTEELRFVSSDTPRYRIDETGRDGLVIWANLGTDWGGLAPGEKKRVMVIFRVQSLVRSTFNQAMVTGVVNNFDDPAASVGSSSDVEVAIAGLTLSATAWPLPGSSVEMGETIAYTVTVHNGGGVALTNMQLQSQLPDGTELIPESVDPAPSAETERETPVRLTWQGNRLEVDATLSFHFRVRVTAEGAMALHQQSTAHSDQMPVPQRTQTIHLSQPTAVQLTHFSAMPTEHGVNVRWQTGAEINSWGFHLWRGTNRVRANAQRITPVLIPARGGLAGADYVWSDNDVSCAPCFYWLQETEIDGTNIDYGPVQSGIMSIPLSQPQILYLPHIRR